MNNILERFRRKQLDRLQEVRRTTGAEQFAPKRERSIPPHIVACRICGGKGTKDGGTCPQCKGSGRVIVSCEVTTHISAYVPENDQKQGGGHGI